MTLDEAIAELAALEASLDDAGGQVRLTREGPVATITLDHPRARHAMTARMMRQLGEAVRTVRGSDAVACVLRSSHRRAFCAGGHLGQVRAGLLDGVAAARMAHGMTGVTDALWNAPQVVVAAMEGPAVGGGAELATACDLRVMHPDARLEFRQAALGVGTGWGGTRRLVAQVGRPRALSWLTAGRAVSREDLAQAGYVACWDVDVHGAVARLLEPWLALPPAGLRAVKQQVASGDAEEATRAFLDAWGGPDHRAALGLDDAG